MLLKNWTAVLFLLFCFTNTFSQDEDFDNQWHLGIMAGAINYQGDLMPNSFTFQNAHFAAGIFVRKPLTKWLSWRAGASLGKLHAADKYNRDYLQPRNLSFYTSIREVYAGLELDVLNIQRTGFTPYLFGGMAYFHFDPWTKDESGNKVYLQPLSTEGQGLQEYPYRKIYGLNQFALAFGGGGRFRFSDCMNISLEFTQRKTFTDYLDDVSTTYIDQNRLLMARGPKAEELAYRGDEIHGGNYPPDGEQRGTPTEKDWYYIIGVTAEIKFACIKNPFAGFSLRKSNNNWYNRKCPSVY